ncbi:hypothetical protein BH18ACT17_BH18ACT17_06070 [soil metagenome]
MRLAGKTLSRLRALIKQADPDVVEELWSHQGPICTGETYASVVKLTFFKGASLKDPSGLFQLKPRRQHPARDRLPRGR